MLSRRAVRVRPSFQPSRASPGPHISAGRSPGHRALEWQPLWVIMRLGAWVWSHWDLGVSSGPSLCASFLQQNLPHGMVQYLTCELRWGLDKQMCTQALSTGLGTWNGSSPLLSAHIGAGECFFMLFWPANVLRLFFLMDVFSLLRVTPPQGRSHKFTWKHVAQSWDPILEDLEFIIFIFLQTFYWRINLHIEKSHKVLRVLLVKYLQMEHSLVALPKTRHRTSLAPQKIPLSPLPVNCSPSTPTSQA